MLPQRSERSAAQLELDGLNRSRQGDLKRAEECWKLVAVLERNAPNSPQLVKAYQKVGFVLSQQNRAPEAVPYFDKGMILQSKNCAARNV
jgi:tetratricopeptide (TPR) repeat protein